jgi:hypothetical protein
VWLRGVSGIFGIVPLKKNVALRPVKMLNYLSPFIKNIRRYSGRMRGVFTPLFVHPVFIFPLDPD